MSDEPTLLRAYAEEGDERAFAEVVRRQVDAVYSAALRRVGGDAHLAEDVTQQVFSALAARAAGVARHPSPTAWLYATTRNLAANVVRSERRRKRREEEAQSMNEQNGTEVDWRRVAPVLDRAIDRLGERERTVVLLRFVERRGWAEIGAALGISADAARMRLERALGRLRDLLAREGVTSTSAALGVALGANVVTAAPSHLAGHVAVSAMTTAGAGGLAGGLMASSMTKALVVAGVCVAAVTGIVALRERQAVADAERRRSTAEAEHAAQLAALRDAEKRVATAEQEAAEARRNATARREAVARLRATQAAVAATSAKSGEVREAVAAANDMMARHPAIRSALIDWHAAKARFQFGPWIEQQGLSPEQAAEFIELVRGENLFGEFGLNGKFVEFRAPREVPREAQRERLLQLLGEDGYRSYRDYQVMARGREYVAQIASQLATTEAPLSPEMARKLVPTFSAMRNWDNSGNFVESAWESTLRALEPQLAPAQLEVLRRIADSERKAGAMMALQRTAAKAAAEGVKP